MSTLKYQNSVAIERSVVVAPAPVAATRKPRNWSMIVRVGLVVGAILFLVGYAVKVTYESVIQGGVVNEGDFYKVELRQMSGFEMDQARGSVADVPPQFRALDGKKVMLEGEVANVTGGDGNKVSGFQVCYSIQSCCMSGPPKIQHFVHCSAPDGRTVTNYLGRGTVKVLGTLHIRVVRDQGQMKSIFQMDVERVEPAT